MKLNFKTPTPESQPPLEEQYERGLSEWINNHEAAHTTEDHIVVFKHLVRFCVHSAVQQGRTPRANIVDQCVNPLFKAFDQLDKEKSVRDMIIRRVSWSLYDNGFLIEEPTDFDDGYDLVDTVLHKLKSCLKDIRTTPGNPKSRQREYAVHFIARLGMAYIVFAQKPPTGTLGGSFYQLVESLLPAIGYNEDISSRLVYDGIRK